MTSNTETKIDKRKERSLRALEVLTAPENAMLNVEQLAEAANETPAYIYNLRWRLNHPEAYAKHNESSVLRGKIKRRLARRRELARQQRELQKQLTQKTGDNSVTPQLELPLTMQKQDTLVTQLPPPPPVIYVKELATATNAVLQAMQAPYDSKPDMVNSPAHYMKGGIETIAFIKAKLSREEYIGYLRGNALKYSSRLGDKDAMEQDAGKLAWYSRELTEFLKESK
jgi:hypothetical protein